MNTNFNVTKNTLIRRYSTRSCLGGKRLNYKNIALLRQFITAQGKIVSRSVSQLTSKQQRKIARYIKYARILAFLPFISNDIQ
jgi:small subunit ribosomal protein S18